MKTKIAAVIGFFALLAIGAELISRTTLAQSSENLAQSSENPPHFVTSTMQITRADGQPVNFDIEVAVSHAEQEYGLMYRRHMDDHAGMMFIENPPIIMTMWMKNTLISLDMLFVDPDGIIRRIVPNAVPESENIISSVEPVRTVIELAGGAAGRLGIKPGDRLTSPMLHYTQGLP